MGRQSQRPTFSDDEDDEAVQKPSTPRRRSFSFSRRRGKSGGSTGRAWDDDPPARPAAQEPDGGGRSAPFEPNYEAKPRAAASRASSSFDDDDPDSDNDNYLIEVNAGERILSPNGKMVAQSSSMYPRHVRQERHTSLEQPRLTPPPELPPPPLQPPQPDSSRRQQSAQSPSREEPYGWGNELTAPRSAAEMPEPLGHTSAADDMDGKGLMQGWLLKRHNHRATLGSQWAKRFFSINERYGTFCYSKSEKKSANITLPLCDITRIERLEIETHGPYCFSVACPPASLILRAADNDECAAWISAISQHAARWRQKALG